MLLVAIWAATAVGADSLPHLWFIYPLFGWGLGLAGHRAGIRSAFPAEQG